MSMGMIVAVVNHIQSNSGSSVAPSKGIYVVYISIIRCVQNLRLLVVFYVPICINFRLIIILLKESRLTRSYKNK